MSEPTPAPTPTPAPPPPAPEPTPAPAPVAKSGKQPEPSPAPEPAPTPDWTSEQWREFLADGDEADLKALGRFKDLKNVWNKAKNQDKLIRSKFARPADDAPPEEVAAWRELFGMPEEPKGFVEALKFADGRVLGDDDKPVVERFAKAILESKNPSPTGILNTIVSEYFNQVEESTAAQQEMDIDSKVECLVSLRKEFGSQKELDRVFKHIELAVFDDAPEGLADNLLRGARGADGKLLGNNPQFMSWLASVAQKAAPISEVMPVGMQTSGGQSRMEQIYALRDSLDPTAQAKYRSPAIQDELMALVDAELRAKNRGRKAA